MPTAGRRVPQHDDEAREDPDHEEAPVDRRVVEHRVDAVEPAVRRVGIVHAHLRVPEDVARLVLHDPDHREHERHQRELDVERDDPRRATRQGGRARSSRSANGSTKKSSSIAPCRGSCDQRSASALPADEERERPAEETELARAHVVAEELPRERERSDGDDPVQRKQQVRLRRADVHGDARRHARERRRRRGATARGGRSRRRRARARRPKTAAAASTRWWPCGAR